MADPGLRFYRIPTIGRMWIPARRVIDGGMAAAVRDPVILRRTLTVYGNVGHVTGPLGTATRSTIALFLLDPSGRGALVGSGFVRAATARSLENALDAI